MKNSSPSQSLPPKASSQNTLDPWLYRMELFAKLGTLVATGGLLGMLWQSASAQVPPPPKPSGFPPGARSLSNPFGNPTNPNQPIPPPPAGGNAPMYFPEDEDDEFGDAYGGGYYPPGSPGANVMPAYPSTPPGAGAYDPRAKTAGPGATGAPQNNPNSVTVGGSNGGVIVKSQQKTLSVDFVSGEGAKETVTDFNYPDADIMDIAKALGRLTGKNFIFDKEVKGRVSIISNSSITVGDAWRAFLTALDINNFALVPSGKYIRIMRKRDAREKQIPTYLSDDHTPNTDGLVTRIFALRYISANEVVRAFRSFLPADVRIIPYDETNTVIVTDTGANLNKFAKMLEMLDVEGYDAGIEVIPVKFASASELSKLIDSLLPGHSTGIPGAPPGAPRSGGRFTSRRTKEGGIVNNIISDERTNTLIVHANNKGADQVRELVHKLDQKLPASVSGGKVHVVYLQYAEAEKIANTLNNISQGAKTAAPGPAGGTGVNPVSNSLFEGSIKVSPDQMTNSLVITASPTDFATVQRVINRLDIPRDQVFVEVIIMEVGSTKDLNVGINIANPPNKAGLITNKDDVLSFIAGGAVMPFVNGAIIGWGGGGTNKMTVNGTQVEVPNIFALAKALQSHAKANILATPQILTLDNSEASFESSDNIPQPIANVGQGGVLQTTFQKEKVELSIKIKPQINKVLNFVKLEVESKLGDITNKVPGELQGKTFATSNRMAKTNVVVGDGDTVVLGGLIRDKSSENVTKIPLLGDIPILGWLFRSTNNISEKTNLLMFMTPRIIRQYDKVREILDKKLAERDEFIERGFGGDDPARGKRDAIIRSLPKIDDIKTRRFEPAVSLDEVSADEKPKDAPLNTNSTAQDSSPQGPPPGVTVAPLPPKAEKTSQNQAPTAPLSDSRPAEISSEAPKGN